MISRGILIILWLPSSLYSTKKLRTTTTRKLFYTPYIAVPYYFATSSKLKVV